MRMTELSTLLRLLAGEDRLPVLWELLHRDCSLGTLVERTGGSAAARRRFLARLAEHGLVTVSRHGREVRYALVAGSVRERVARLHDLDATGGAARRQAAGLETASASLLAH